MTRRNHIQRMRDPLPVRMGVGPCFLLFGLMLWTVGCSASEAVVDGVYGGISETISMLISTLALGALEVAS